MLLGFENNAMNWKNGCAQHSLVGASQLQGQLRNLSQGATAPLHHPVPCVASSTCVHYSWGNEHWLTFAGFSFIQIPRCISPWRHTNAHAHGEQGAVTNCCQTCSCDLLTRALLLLNECPFWNTWLSSAWGWIVRLLNMKTFILWLLK